MDKAFGDLLDVKQLYPEAVKTLFAAMADVGDESVYKKNDVFFDFKRDWQSIILIESGVVGVYRKSDRLLVTETFATAVIGLIQFTNKPDLIVVAHGDLKIKKVPRTVALKIIEQQGLWHEVALVMGHMVKRYTERDVNFIARDAYHIIKHHLTMLMELPVEERYATTAVKFITSRTNLSRSRVMDILKTLNDGEYIAIKNGILLKVHLLPERF